MRKIVIAVAVCLACLAIVLPVVGTGNPSNVVPTSQPSVYQADGAPMPPPIPPWYVQENTNLVADGAPMPPPIPPWNASEPTLLADGAPMPPPIPPWNAVLAAAV